MRPMEGILITDSNEVSFYLNSLFEIIYLIFQSSNSIVQNINQKSNDSQSSRRSSHSTTNTDDDQYELVRRLTTTNNQISTETKPISSPEMLSSATSLSSPSSSSDEDEPEEKAIEKTITPISHESGRFESAEMTAEQANLLEEASKTA